MMKVTHGLWIGCLESLMDTCRFRRSIRVLRIANMPRTERAGDIMEATARFVAEGFVPLLEVQNPDGTFNKIRGKFMARICQNYDCDLAIGQCITLFTTEDTPNMAMSNWPGAGQLVPPWT